MPVIRWRNRFAVLTLVLLAGLAILVSSSHRSRLIAGSFIVVDSIDSLENPSSAAFECRFMPGADDPSSAADDPSSAADDPSSAADDPSSAADSSQSGMAQAIATLSSFATLHPMVSGDDLPAIDDPDTCLKYLAEGRRLHCYNVDIAACKLLAQQGIRVRMWDWNGPNELGGFGHNLLEVFDAPTASWRVIDPYYHCYFIVGADSSPVNGANLRRALLTSSTALHMYRYAHVSPERRDTDIVAELRFLAPCAMLHANNDFTWRYQHRYGCLMPLTSIIDKLPLRVSRGVRTVMMGRSDVRYIVQDASSPEYPVQALQCSFHALLLLLLASGIGLVWLTRVSRRERRQTTRYE